MSKVVALRYNSQIMALLRGIVTDTDLEACERAWLMCRIMANAEAGFQKLSEIYGKDCMKAVLASEREAAAERLREVEEVCGNVFPSVRVGSHDGRMCWRDCYGVNTDW